MLRERFDVDLGTDWTREELLDRIGTYHGILIRSATKLDAEVIDRADNLGSSAAPAWAWTTSTSTAASKKGIIVANAPEANTVAAAEHTVALMLALARNIPQAHASLTSGKWERSKFGGTEVDGKTLGVLGFGRIGQLVAIRARRLRHARRRLRPVRRRRALPRARRREGRVADDVLAAGRLPHAAPAEDPGDAGLHQHRDARQDARTACASSTSPAGR